MKSRGCASQMFEGKALAAWSCEGREAGKELS